LKIADCPIGPGFPAYLIAELSGNHNGDFSEATRLVRAAKECGANAVKLQTYTPDTITIDGSRPEFRIGGGSLWEGLSLYDLYAQAHMPWEWQPKLKQLADDLGLHLFSSPFDFSSVDFLEAMGVPAYKIASPELVDIPLIRKVAAMGKPMIMSTGMATLAEIDEAVQAARGAGATQIALLKCTSGYPAAPEEMNLRTIPHMAEGFGLPVGLSDHTLSVAIPAAAIALGASLIEKHFTLSRAAGGPDSAFSLEPAEFRAMVDAVRTTEAALGHVQYGASEREAATRAFRRSLYVVQDVHAGQLFSAGNVRSIRPSNGLLPRHLDDILGRIAACDIPAGTPLSWDLIG
jgi:pseudaminic acid synthase